tara:strand:+ start:3047 stop:3340 length:294 start_codon:yes stop_codon:yes gene_type:complete
MTKISSNDVRKVAKLARMDLPEDELALYADQLEKILGYIEQLEKVETKGVKPTTRAVEVINVLREDIVNSPEMREELLDLAPNREGDFFKVPKILSD